MHDDAGFFHSLNRLDIFSSSSLCGTFSSALEGRRKINNNADAFIGLANKYQENPKGCFHTVARILSD